ncbi:MAG: fibronectin type III domain-containing protein, partial [bacterium]
MKKISNFKCSKLLSLLAFIMLISGLNVPVYSETDIHLQWDATTGSVIVSWTANSEPDLAGYKVYYGMESKNYSQFVNAGNTTIYSIGTLTAGQTYYFAVTAYDESGNESDWSTEVSFEVQDTEPPEIVKAFCMKNDLVVVEFNEKLDAVSSQIASNYSISNGIIVQTAKLQSDEKTVHLTTLAHQIGNYVLTVTGFK